jgi:hypothetical protein
MTHHDDETCPICRRPFHREKGVLGAIAGYVRNIFSPPPIVMAPRKRMYTIGPPIDKQPSGKVVE